MQPWLRWPRRYSHTLCNCGWGDLGGTATNYATVADLQHARVNFQTICFACVQFGFVTPELGRAMKVLHYSARHGWDTNCVWLWYESHAVFKHKDRTWRLTCHCTAIQPAYHRALVGPLSDADVPISWLEGQACTGGYCCQPLVPVHSDQDILQSSEW